MSEHVVRRPFSRRPLRIGAAAALAFVLTIASATLGALPANASSTASISGVVTGSDSPGVGLANVQVQLNLAGGTQVDSTSTDSTGAYSFTGLQAATYRVQFSDDYTTGHLGTTSSPLTVSDGQTASGVNASLVLGGIITGTVSLASGPLTQPVSVALIKQGATVTGIGDLFAIGTAADGSFTFTGISAGSYTLAFMGNYFGQPADDVAPQFWSGATTLADASYFTVTPGQTVTDRNAVLQQGSSVSGTVTAAGSPVSFGFVQAVEQNGWIVANGSTASDGTYTLHGLPAGPLTLEFLPSFAGNFLPQWWSGASTAADATYFDVPAATALTGYDVQLASGASISGTIEDADGNPIPFSSVYALKAGNVYGVSGFVDGSGTYTIGGLSAGDYTVQFDGSGGSSYATSWWNGASTQATATLIHVADQQQVTGIDTHLGQGATISGTVSGLASDGNTFAAANATITAYRPDGSQASQVYADQSGSYSVSNLPAGTYDLYIEPQGDTTDFAPQWYLDAASQAIATPLTVTAGQTLGGTDVTLAAAVSLPHLTTATATISGAARVGNTLTAKPGAWKPKHVTFAYQWLRSGVPIAGATHAQYHLVQADAGSTLTVSVTGSKTGYASATVASAPTSLVTGGKLTGVRPTISGTPQVGSTLTAVTGNWSPAPVTLAIQWLRDGKKIAGATAPDYVVVAADRGAKLTASVTGSKPGFTPDTETSATVKVAK